MVAVISGACILGIAPTAGAAPPADTRPPDRTTPANPPADGPPEEGRSGEKAVAPELAPSARSATIAHLLAPTPVRARPSAGVRSTERLGTRAAWAGGPMRLLVLDSAFDERERLWVKVRLHRRPNTAAGWIPADRAQLETTPWRVVLKLGSRRITVYNSGRAVRRFRAVIGTNATPTPTGLFAIAEEVFQGSPNGFLGPWALHLTAHSKVHYKFDGGDGRIAIHGRGGASFLDPLGSARSNGCIRVNNIDINWLTNRVTPGVPVRVKR